MKSPNLQENYALENYNIKVSNQARKEENKKSMHVFFYMWILAYSVYMIVLKTCKLEYRIEFRQEIKRVILGDEEAQDIVKRTMTLTSYNIISFF